MELTREQQKILADLHGHPAFLVLIQSLKDFEENILGKLEGLVDDKKLAHVARYYQFTKVLRVRLESEVENAYTDSRKHEEAEADLNAFSQHPGQELEDFLSKWSKIVEDGLKSQ